MEMIAEFMFWAGLVSGLASLGVLWWMRRAELDDQRSAQHELKVEQDMLRAEIVDLKAILRSQERVSE